MLFFILEEREREERDRARGDGARGTGAGASDAGGAMGRDREERDEGIECCLGLGFS